MGVRRGPGTTAFPDPPTARVAVLEARTRVMGTAAASHRAGPLCHDDGWAGRSEGGYRWRSGDLGSTRVPDGWGASGRRRGRGDRGSAGRRRCGRRRRARRPRAHAASRRRLARQGPAHGGRPRAGDAGAGDVGSRRASSRTSSPTTPRSRPATSSHRWPRRTTARGAARTCWWRRERASPRSPTCCGKRSRSLVSAALAQLPRGDRDVLMAHEVDGEDTITMAEGQGTTPGAVAARLSRARASLRVEYLLLAEGVEPPTDRCRPVLRALSSGDRRRQRELDVSGHVLGCAACARIKAELFERREEQTDGWRGARVRVARTRTWWSPARRAARSRPWWGSRPPTRPLIATAISEVSRNIVKFAERGEVVISLISSGAGRGVSVVARDVGAWDRGPRRRRCRTASAPTRVRPRSARRQAADGSVRPGFGPRRRHHRDHGEVVVVTGSTPSTNERGGAEMTDTTEHPDRGQRPARPQRGRGAAARAGRAPSGQPDPTAAAVGRAHHAGPPALGDDRPGGLLRGDLGLRQLRRGVGDGQRGGPPALCPRPLRADHPPRCRDPRGGRHRPAAARRAGALPVREVPRRLRPPQPGAGRLRAGSQPHRQHRGGELRRAARARHPGPAGRVVGALHPCAAGARAAADPAHHRRPGRHAGPSS